jgi:hypothetical protein
MLSLIPIYFFLITASAQDFLEAPEEDLNPSTEEVLIKKPEKYQRHESMVYDLNPEMGIKDQRRYTGLDNHRVSLSGHLSSDYEHFTDILGADFTYMHRSNRYNRIWYGLQIFQHQTYFDAITQNHTGTSTNPRADSNIIRPGDVKNTVTAAGLGVGYRFKLLLEFIEVENWFENIDVYANLLELNETFIEEKYRGYGLTANYGLHKRASTHYFYGVKFSYNLASVTRDALNKEKFSERTLSLGWLSAALEIGFFY